MRCPLVPVLLLCALLPAARLAAQSFVNWESPHVHPLDITPDGSTLIAANTADNRVEIYAIDGPDTLTHVGSIPVGLDPVSVRARTVDEVWVVNRISDSVSLVDLASRSVRATIRVGDEPGDVVFAGSRAFVSIGTLNQVWAYDLPYDAAASPAIVDIAGEDPRALATDGTSVYAAIFNAGNGTTVLTHALVTNQNISPYGGENPPPNLGDEFEPPINPDLLGDEDSDGVLDIRMPRSSMILKMDDAGVWRDEQGADWSAGPFWTLHRNAMARIDATTLEVTYVTRLMTSNMALDVSPATGDVAVVGTHALNHIRFEPNLRGRFMSVGEAIVGAGGGVDHHDLNPHIADFFPDPQGIEGIFELPGVVALPVNLREQSIGDPRGIAWSPDGSYRLVTGRGSNTLVKVGPNGGRIGQVFVGQGPTGVRFHETGIRVYVLNKFDGSISIVEPETLELTASVSYHDPTPAEIRSGRPHFYNTHVSSGFGHLSCQSCHVDGGMDLLAWDLGDPSGEVKQFNQVCINDSPICDEEDWHPMKGPMTTQTLIGLEDTEPFHWRGDREDLAAFNGAFVSLLASQELSDDDMEAFTAFVNTMQFPPNPFRGLDGELLDTHPNGGDPQRGEFLFTDNGGGGGDGGGAGMPDFIGHLPQPRGPAGGGDQGFNCAGCHALPTGTNTEILRPFISDGVSGIHHLTKTAQLRNMYRKDGFDAFAEGPVSRGTGFLHDGSLDTIQTFLMVFFAMDLQDRLDLEAFMMSLATDTHAGVGTQVTIDGASNEALALRDLMIGVTETTDVALVAKGIVGGLPRGYHYLAGGNFQSDRAAETVSTADLDLASGPGSEITYTLVPTGTHVRIGVDRDEDGSFDRDELDACSDPANPDIVPEGGCCADASGDLVVDVVDLVIVILEWGPCPDSGGCQGDVNGDLVVDVEDLVEVVLAWGPC